MKISRNNYESFFLDYLEGNLEEDQIDQFLDFLEQNQDLKEELHLFENIRLPEEQIAFPEKTQLYKEEVDQYFEQRKKLVPYFEGDLENEEKLAFETYLTSHPKLQKEYRQLTQTRLISDFEIKFPNKRKLYRKTGTVIWINWLVRAAAVALLIWGIQALVKPGNHPTNQHEIAEIMDSNSKQILPVEKLKNVQKATCPIVPVKQGTRTLARRKYIKIQTKNIEIPVERHETVTFLKEPELIALFEIAPKKSYLNADFRSPKLAVSTPVSAQKPLITENVMTIDEFLADRAKKVGNEGLLSVKKLARFGLDVASELSGERIGYQMKDGKITSIDYESKLMAFSIPMKKK